MSEGRTRLREGTRVLTRNGTGVVVSVGSSGYVIRDAFGELELVGWLDEVTVREISRGEIAPLAEALRPLWDALDESAKRVALDRLEVVQEIITGYRDGHRDLARRDEPRYPFGPGFGISESRRCDVMAGLLAEEQRHDRTAQRRLRDGEIQVGTTNPSTIRNWVRSWKDGGLRALIDGRSLRARKPRELIDSRYRALAEQVLDTLDGDKSTVSIKEIDRRIRVRLIDSGVRDPRAPERITGEYLSTLKRQRAHASISTSGSGSSKLSGIESFGS